jgi:hypothetical protein
VTLTRDQSVRVASFQETQRSEESVLFQEGLTLAPGSWKISVVLGEPTGARSSRAEAQYAVPRFGPGSITPLYLAYQVVPSSSTPISVILNARGTVACRAIPRSPSSGRAPARPAGSPGRLVTGRDG